MNRIWIGLVASAFALAAPARAIVAAPVATGQSGSSSANSLGDTKFINSSGVISTSSAGSYYRGHGTSSNILSVGVGATKLVSETHVSGDGASGASAGSYSTLRYFFSVAGPTPTVFIKLSAIAELSRSAFNYNPALNYYMANQVQHAEVSIRDDKNYYVFGGHARSGYFYGPNSTMEKSGMFIIPGAASNTMNPINQVFSGTFSGSKTGKINTNQQYSIFMTLYDAISLYPYPPLNGSSSASLSNLSVELASSVVNPSDYHLTFGNPAAVPEPASWAMLIAGFGLTGAMMRRKKQNHSLG